MGAVGALCGELDNLPICEFSIEEEDYFVMIISTYGGNEWVGDEKYSIIFGMCIIFKYPYTVHNHFPHRDSVGSHNKRLQKPFSVEEIWCTRL